VGCLYAADHPSGSVRHPSVGAPERAGPAWPYGPRMPFAGFPPIAVPLLAGVAVVLATTAGCGAEPAPEKAAVPVASTGAVLTAGSGDSGLDRFVEAVQRQLPEVALDRRDEEVEELGEQACDSLAAGEKDAAVAGEIGEQGVASADARTLVALARTTACPGRPKVRVRP